MTIKIRISQNLKIFSHFSVLSISKGIAGNKIKNFKSKSSYKLIGVFENESGVKLKAELNQKYYSVEDVKLFLKNNTILESFFPIRLFVDKYPFDRSFLNKDLTRRLE